MRMSYSRSQDASSDGRFSIHSRPLLPRAWETFSSNARGSFMGWRRASPPRMHSYEPRGRPLRDLHTGELILSAPVFEDLDERNRTAAERPILSAAFARLALVVVVPRRARLEKLAARPRQADDR